MENIMFIWLVLLTIIQGFLAYRVWEIGKDIEFIDQLIGAILPLLPE